MATNGFMKTLGLAGAALAAWYLLDPKRGAERRDRIMTGARDLYDNAGKELSRLSEDLAAGVSDVVDRVTQATGIGGKGTVSNGSANASGHGTNAGGSTRPFTPGEGSQYTS